MNNKQKLDFFKDLMSCNHLLFFWTYDRDMHLTDSNCPNEELLDDLLTLSQCRDYLKKHIDDADMPIILSDSLGLIWAAVFEKEMYRNCAVHVMGPAFVNQNSMPNIEARLNAHNLSVRTKQQMLRRLKALPLITSNTFFQYAVMFHFCIRNEKIVIGDLQHQSPFRDFADASSPAQFHEPSLPKEHALPMDAHPGIRNAEEQLLSMVRTGNLNYQEALGNASQISQGMRSHLGDPIQQAKFSSISFLTLCSRAAIAGGLPPATAYDLCDIYGESIDNCKTTTELTVSNKSMYEDFITRVHKCRQNPDVSPAIQSCCDYIDMHITQDISIEQLADMTGYTTYYLSRKFKVETGIPITKYINRQKVELAKTMLATTRDTISEISDRLSFCSRSYFADVFLRETGVSPSRWREGKRQEAE